MHIGRHVLEVVVGQQPSQEEVQKAWAKYSILLLALLPTGKPSVAVAFTLGLAEKNNPVEIRLSAEYDF